MHGAHFWLYLESGTYNFWLGFKLVSNFPKGQLLTKGLFVVIVSTKKQQIFVKISVLASKKESNQIGSVIEFKVRTPN